MTTVLLSLAATGTAVFIAGHEVPTLLSAADHVSWCTKGTTRELGALPMAAAHEAFQREYLGSGWSAGVIQPTRVPQNPTRLPSPPIATCC